MTCKFKYIENADIEQVKKDLLTNLHIEAMKEIASAEVDGELLFNNKITVGKNKAIVMQKYVDSKAGADKRAKQLNFLNELNKKLRKELSYDFKLELNTIVGYTRAEVYPNAFYDLVYVNLTPYTNDTQLFSGLNFASDLDYNKYFDTMLSEYYEPEYIKHIDEVAVLLDDSNKRVKIIDFLDQLYNKFDSYATNTIFNKNTDSEFSNSTVKDDLLTKFFYSLKNDSTNEVSERVHNITNTVAKGYRILNYIDSRFKKTIDPLIKTIENVEVADYEKLLANASSVLSEAAVLMNALEPLKQMLSEIITSVQWDFWSSYNTVKIERELIKKYPSRKQEIIDVLQSEAKNINEVTVGFLTKGFETEDIKSILEILNSSLLTSRNFVMEAYQKMLSTYGQLQSNLAAAHYDIVTTALFNEQKRSAGDNYEALVAANKLPTKEELRQQLKVATSDISSVNEWLASGATLNDHIARLYVYYVQEPLRMANYYNKMEATESEEFLQKLNLSLKDADLRRAYEKQMVQEINYLDPAATAIEVPEDYDPSTDPDAEKKGIIEIFGKKFFTQKGLAFVSEIDWHRLSYENKFHKYTLKERAQKASESVGKIVPRNSQTYKDLVTLENYGFVELEYTDTGVKVFSTRKGISVDKFKSVLNKNFYSSRDSLKSTTEVNAILMEQSKTLNYAEMVADLNKKHDSAFYSYLKKNSYTVPSSDEITEDMYERALGSTFGKSIIGVTGDGDYVQVNVEKTKYKYKIKNTNVNSIIILQKDFVNIDKSYYSEAYKKLDFNNPVFSEYYKHLTSKYKEANKKMGNWKLHFNLLPFVPTEQTQSFWQKTKNLFTVSGLKDLVNSLDFQEQDVKVRKAMIDGEFVMVDHNGKPTTIPHYIKNVDTNNNPIRELIPKYTRNLYSSGIEQDLFVNLFIFGNSATSYDAISQAEPMTRIFKSLLISNPTLGIEARQAIQKDSLFSNFLYKTNNQVLTKNAEKSTNALLSFIDDYVYGVSSNDVAVFNKYSAKKLTRVLKQSIAYQVLANNWIAAGTNTSLGTIANFAASMGKRHGLDSGIMSSAYNIYRKNLITWLKDFKETSRKDQSMYTQLAYLFDAVKGSYEEGRGNIEIGNLKDRALRSLLYTSSIAPEHMNQMTMFIGFMHAYDVLPGLKFIDLVQHTDGQAIKFDLDKYNEKAVELGKKKLTTEQFEKTIISTVQRKVGKLMYEAHGQYDLLDKAKIERDYLYSVGYLFQRWLYPGFKTRFGVNGIYDAQVGNVEEEGYILTYLKDMLNYNDSLMNELEGLTFVESFIASVKKQNIKTIGMALGTQVGKQAAWVINRLMKVFKMDNTKMEDWIFGNATEEVRNRLNKAYFEISIFLSTILLGWLLMASIDDDDDDDILTKTLLVQVKRLQSDIGFFLDPFTMGDRLALKMQDPFSIKRAYDMNTGVLKQLIGFGFDDSGLNFTFNDKYERAGNGYEKGDYKLAIKSRKAFLSPYHQIIRLLNPQEQLNYLDMIYKN